LEAEVTAATAVLSITGGTTGVWRPAKTRAAAPPTPPATAEAALIQAAKARAPDAFSRLVATHQQGVRAFLRRLCGDHAQADDLAQETFLTAWMQIGRFDPKSSFRAWLCGIAYRKHMTARRSWLRGLKRDGDWAEGRGESVAEDRSRERVLLHAAMGALPPDQRAAVALCLAADFSHTEAAEALGLPLGTIKSHVARGRAKLLDALGGSDD